MTFTKNSQQISLQNQNNLNIMEIQHFKSKEDYLKSKELLLKSKYSIKSENDSELILTTNTSTVGIHILLLIIFGFWTLGIVNLAYYLFSIKRITLVKPVDMKNLKKSILG